MNTTTQTTEHQTKTRLARKRSMRRELDRMQETINEWLTWHELEPQERDRLTRAHNLAEWLQTRLAVPPLDSMPCEPINAGFAKYL